MDQKITDLAVGDSDSGVALLTVTSRNSECDGRLAFVEILQLALQLRSTHAATVTDIASLRDYTRRRMDRMESRVVNMSHGNLGTDRPARVVEQRTAEIDSPADAVSGAHEAGMRFQVRTKQVTVVGDNSAEAAPRKHAHDMDEAMEVFLQKLRMDMIGLIMEFRHMAASPDATDLACLQI